MPLVENGQVVQDRYLYVGDDEPIPNRVPIIVSAKRFFENVDALIRRDGSVGVVWPNDRRVAELAPWLGHLALVALVFPKFRDGRAYSQARLLRETYGFGGMLRATGDVLRDQFQFLVRAGFNSFEVKKPGDAGVFAEAVGNFGFGDLRLAEPLEHFAQGRFGDAFCLGGLGHAGAELPVQQEMPDVRRDLDREARPILELGDGVLCIERLLPRFQQLELVRVALDVFRQDGNVVIAQIDEAGLVEPRPLFVFGLRKRDPHPRRQAAIFLPDDDDEEVALTNLFEADVERPSGPGAEELHRVVTLLDAKNGVEDRLALLLEVVEGAAEEHSERRGHRVSLRPIERG